MKGVPVSEERNAVSASLERVSLTSLEHRLSKRLSGGEKRRLSIAIALIGDPLIVFLDEPTTGLDPEVRRLIWNIIEEAKVGRSIILTTHSMEEAEALCPTIGIMSKGTLRCLANPLRLKELYGNGFKLFFNTNTQDTQRACAWIETLLPSGWEKIDSFSTNTSYQFPASEEISGLFEMIEMKRAEFGIIDWGISQTTLEEVFLRIISDDDANAD
jgi:ABC-type multidrug transport system ATPase subunit